VKRVLVGLGLLPLCLSPASALACSVCYTANEANRMAFLDTTVFLSLFPLAMLGAIVWWVWRQVQLHDS
jgi:hypothetical protein